LLKGVQNRRALPHAAARSLHRPAPQAQAARERRSGAVCDQPQGQDQPQGRDAGGGSAEAQVQRQQGACSNHPLRTRFTVHGAAPLALHCAGSCPSGAPPCRELPLPHEVPPTSTTRVPLGGAQCGVGLVVGCSGAGLWPSCPPAVCLPTWGRWVRCAAAAHLPARNQRHCTIARPPTRRRWWCT